MDVSDKAKDESLLHCYLCIQIWQIPAFFKTLVEKMEYIRKKIIYPLHKKLTIELKQLVTLKSIIQLRSSFIFKASDEWMRKIKKVETEWVRTYMSPAKNLWGEGSKENFKGGGRGGRGGQKIS
jgi:hypothetical protein